MQHFPKVSCIIWPPNLHKNKMAAKINRSEYICVQTCNHILKNIFLKHILMCWMNWCYLQILLLSFINQLMWIKTKWLPVFNQNYRFNGISLVSLITFNQIESFSTQFLYADSKTHSSSKSESVLTLWFHQNHWLTKQVEYQTDSTGETMSTDSNNRAMSI